MLSTQLSFVFQPQVEKSRLCLYHLQRLKRDVLMTLGFIVRIDGLKGTVEDGGKLVQ